MMRLVDKDGNGSIDFKEFLTLMDSNCIVADPEQELSNIFKQIDSDNNGFLEEKELTTMFQSFGQKVKKKDIKKMMKYADANKDGRISYSEFKDMIQNGNFLSAT